MDGTEMRKRPLKDGRGWNVRGVLSTTSTSNGKAKAHRMRPRAAGCRMVVVVVARVRRIAGVVHRGGKGGVRVTANPPWKGVRVRGGGRRERKVEGLPKGLLRPPASFRTWLTEVYPPRRVSMRSAMRHCNICWTPSPWIMWG